VPPARLSHALDMVPPTQRHLAEVLVPPMAAHLMQIHGSSVAGAALAGRAHVDDAACPGVQCSPVAPPKSGDEHLAEDEAVGPDIWVVPVDAAVVAVNDRGRGGGASRCDQRQGATLTRAAPGQPRVSLILGTREAFLPSPCEAAHRGRVRQSLRPSGVTAPAERTRPQPRRPWEEAFGRYCEAGSTAHAVGLANAPGRDADAIDSSILCRGTFREMHLSGSPRSG
jgi:hypothetical protein